MLADALKEHRAKGGSIIAMDMMNGEILAMATSPGVKYSTLDENLAAGDAESLSILNNKAVTDLYEPGSVMKIITAAAAIDAGVVSPGNDVQSPPLATAMVTTLLTSPPTNNWIGT